MIQLILTDEDSVKWLEEFRAVGRRLDNIEAALVTLTHQGTLLMATAEQVRTLVTQLRDDVAAQTTVVASVHTLIGNLAAMIADLKNQILAADNIPADIVDAVSAVDAAVKQSKDQLAADVAANTGP